MTKKIKLKISARLSKKKIRRSKRPTKACKFCLSVENERLLDFKNAGFLRGFLTERSKILPSRISGNCTLHQRMAARHIKCARSMALLPYTAHYF
jgi:small subunit ribosomal protein S18